METDSKILQKYLKEGQITIFSIPNCGYCDKLKYFLAKEEVKYTFVDCSKESLFQKEKNIAELKAIYGNWSYPRTFLGLELVGGGSDLRRLLKEKAN